VKSLDEAESEMRTSAWSSARPRGGAPLVDGGAPLVDGAPLLTAALAALSSGSVGLADEWRRPAVSSGGAVLRRAWIRRQALAKSRVTKARRC